MDDILDRAHLGVHRDGPVAVAELKNPRKRNAITTDMWCELYTFADEIRHDPSVRAVVLRGSVDVFCAGADIASFETARNSTRSVRAYDDRIDTVCSAIETLPQPTIAMLAGPVVGAGLELAACCDIRIAADNAYLMLPAAKLGLGFDPRGIAHLARAFGPALARQLLVTADRITAVRAHTLGAVNELVAPDELVRATMDVAHRVGGHAPLTIAAAKLSLHSIEAAPDPDGFDRARTATDAANRSEDYAEGRAAFAQRRPPRFKGH